MNGLKVEQLVKENSEKRSLLTEDNENYYTDLLVYVRLQWRLSERQTEEVLLEMLDHLLDGQNEGKSAANIFGKDPLLFADQLIKEISQEKPRNMLFFLTGLATLLLGWVLIIGGLINIIFSFFTEVSYQVNLFHTSLSALMIIIFIVLVILVTFKTIKKDLFKEYNRKRERKSSRIVGLTAGLSMLVVLLLIKFLPKIGPSFNFNPILSIALGAVLLLIYYGVKNLSNK